MVIKIPKIALRTACDHFNNTNSTDEEKTPFISYYFPSGGSQVREPSVQDRFGRLSLTHLNLSFFKFPHPHVQTE